MHALASSAPGSVRTPVTLRYRTWEGQMTAEPAYINREAKLRRREAYRAFIDAYRVAHGLDRLPE
jgi:hypothetical protein